MDPKEQGRAELLERAADLETEYDKLLALLADPELVRDRNAFRETSQRHKQLEEVVRARRALAGASDDLSAAREMFEEAVGDERELAREEVAEGERQAELLEAELRELLLPGTRTTAAT